MGGYKGCYDAAESYEKLVVKGEGKARPQPRLRSASIITRVSSESSRSCSRLSWFWTTAWTFFNRFENPS